jgi:hypothetical protein
MMYLKRTKNIKKKLTNANYKELLKIMLKSHENNIYAQLKL